MANSASQMQDALFVIRALREYIEAIPVEVVAKLPAMPGIDADWMDRVEENLESSAAAPATAVAKVLEGKLCNRLEWLSDDVMESTPVGSMLCIASAEAQPSVELGVQHNALLQLAQQVARLNPKAGEIGSGMLAQLVAQAKEALPNAEE